MADPRDTRLPVPKTNEADGGLIRRPISEPRHGRVAVRARAWVTKPAPVTAVRPVAEAAVAEGPVAAPRRQDAEGGVETVARPGPRR